MDYIKIKRQSLLLLLCLIPMWGFSQNITVKGIVEDASGERLSVPVYYKKVLAKVSSYDLDGNF
jgi:hypothetical protein